MKTLGVIGGMGPLATAHYMKLLVEMTDADRDQDNLEALVVSRPSIPDRTAFILGRSQEDPAPEMIRAGRQLAEMGAEILGITCMTAHYFYSRVAEAVPVPVIHAVRETAAELKKEGVACAGILATEGTVRAGVFADELEKAGIRPVLPDGEGQREITGIIYNCVKAGRPAEGELFCSAAAKLRGQGAEVFILGCTELSVLDREQLAGARFIDALEVLARESVLRCGAPLKQKYRQLIFRGGDRL